MDRPTSKATKADWIAYADAVEQARDAAEADAAEARAELAALDDGSLVRQLRRRIHELNGRTR